MAEAPLLTEQQLRRGVFRSTRELEQAIRDYIDSYSVEPKPSIWTKIPDKSSRVWPDFVNELQRDMTLGLDTHLQPSYQDRKESELLEYAIGILA